MSEEARFRAELHRSSEEMWRLALAFHRPGETWCRYFDPACRPSFDQRHAYGDRYDFVVCHEDGRDWKFEVKFRENYNFDSASAFGFDTINVDRVGKCRRNRGLVAGYISFNRRSCALIKTNTLDHWKAVHSQDNKKGYSDIYIYRCPVNFAIFGSHYEAAARFYRTL